MKMLVLLEVEVSKTVAETMQRTGFELSPDGTCLQVKVPNSPAIPQRKTKVVFVGHPKHTIQELLQVLSTEKPVPVVEPAPESK